MIVKLIQRWGWAMMLLLTAITVHGQEPLFQRVNFGDNFPDREIHQVKQDPFGRLWFATERGVFCHDGVSLSSYSTREGLCDNTVFGLFIEPGGRVWVHTHKGCISYIDSGKVFTPDWNREMLEHLSGSFATSLYVDQGQVWVNSGSKSCFIDTSGQVYPQIDLGEESLDRKKAYFDTRSGNVSRITSRMGRVMHEFQVQEENWTFAYPLGLDSVFYVHCGPGSVLSSQKELFISSRNQLFGMKEGRLQTAKLPEDATNSLYESPDGDLWVGCLKRGLFRYENGNLNRLKNRYLQKLSVTSVLVDREGGIWVTSLEEGVHYCPNPNLFGIKKELLPEKESIVTLATNSDCVLIGTRQGGVFCLDPSGPKQVMQLREVHEIKTLSSGDFLVVGLPENSHKFQGFLIHRNSKEISLLPGSGSKVAFIDKEDNIHWVYVLSDDREIHLQSIDGEKLNTWVGQAEITGFPNACAIDSDSTLWVATTKGLMKTSMITGLSQATGEVPEANFTDLEITDAKVVASSLGEGIYCFRGDTAININEVSGLASNLCNSLLVDGDTLWVSTGAGISRIIFGPSLLDYTVVNLPVLKGEGRSLALKGDTLFLASYEEVIYLDKNTPLHCPLPPVYIRGHQPWKSTTEALFQQGSRPSISFDAYQFQECGNWTYQYTIDGSKEEGWTSLSEKEVPLDHLPAGEYTFRVRTVNHNGQHGDESTLKFSIRAPRNYGWWYLPASGSVLVLAFLLLLGRKKKFQKRLSELKTESKTTEEERDKLQREIQEKERQITSFAILLENKNEVLDRIQNITGQPRKGLGREEQEELLNMIQKSRSIDEDVQDFMIYFEKADPDFFKALLNRTPGLTKSDLRYCALFRLGMENKEVARYMNISYKAVKMARYRIKKKLQLEPEVNLDAFLTNL